jgi:signal transduction histidine kinase
LQNKKPTVLFVDDEFFKRESIKLILERITEKYFVCANIREALEIYKNNDIDIVFCDINMPELNGIEFSKKIKEINSNQAIVLVAALNDSKKLIDAIVLDLDGYLVKPISGDKLSKKITEIYEKVILKQKVREQQKIIIQQQRMVSMGEMIGSIAHQWRQPLNSLGSLITNLHIKYDSKTINQYFYESFFYKSDLLIQNMSETIEDFSNFFKPNKEIQKFCLNETINESIKFFRNIIYTDDMNFEYESSNNIKISNYKNELLQVIMNIFKNSYDAYIENDIKEKYMNIKSYVKKDMVYIIIKDKAGGIPTDKINRVFELYYTTKHDSKGTGIGLYISKIIIENSMGGLIKINNTEEGVCTTVSLPI